MRPSVLDSYVRASVPVAALRRSRCKQRIARIRLAVFDIDGVLTDGRVHLGHNDSPLRSFDIKDGLGLVQMAKVGVHLAAISSSRSSVGVERLKTLGFESINIGVDNKLSVLHDVCARLGVSLRDTSFMGDDIPDIECLQAVGLSCAPRNAVLEVRAIADFVSPYDGGRGAIRTLADEIVKSRASSRGAPRATALEEPRSAIRRQFEPPIGGR